MPAERVGEFGETRRHRLVETISVAGDGVDGVGRRRGEAHVQVARAVLNAAQRIAGRALEIGGEPLDLVAQRLSGLGRGSDEAAFHAASAILEPAENVGGRLREALVQRLAVLCERGLSRGGGGRQALVQPVGVLAELADRVVGLVDIERDDALGLLLEIGARLLVRIREHGAHALAVVLEGAPGVRDMGRQSIGELLRV